MKGIRKLQISLLLLFSLSALVLIQVRCKHAGINAADLDKVSYKSEIEPIFTTSCGISGCHNGKGGESGLSFTDYPSIMKSITASNPDKSKAYRAITAKGFTQLMPPAGALPIEKRILVRVWIEQGAANN